MRVPIYFRAFTLTVPSYLPLGMVAAWITTTMSVGENVKWRKNVIALPRGGNNVCQKGLRYIYQYPKKPPIGSISLGANYIGMWNIKNIPLFLYHTLQKNLQINRLLIDNTVILKENILHLEMLNPADIPTESPFIDMLPCAKYQGSPSKYTSKIKYQQ